MRRALFLLMMIAAIAPITSAQATKSGNSNPATILVLRFETPGDVDGADWIGRAAQEDLSSDLARGALAHIKAPFETKPVVDVDAALKRGRELHANYVVYGQAQSVEENVRITTQVLDVAAGQPLGTAKITGPRSSLFDLEDALTRQVFALLPQSIVKPDVLRSLQEQPAASVVELSQPEPEPIRIFPAFASPDYEVPERYESDPAVVINVVPAPNAWMPPYTYLFPPPFTDSPFAYSPYAYGFPFNGVGPGGLYDGISSAWYPEFGYPLGWPSYGGVVIVNNGFGLRRGFGFHHHGNVGGQGGGRSNNMIVSNGNNSIAVQFDFQGGPIAFGGLPGRGFAPPIPAGGFAVGIPQTGFNSFGGPRFGGMRGLGFRGPAFGGGIRGGSAVH